jgi:hypothetical protein
MQYFTGKLTFVVFALFLVVLAVSRTGLPVAGRKHHSKNKNDNE